MELFFKTHISGTGGQRLPAVLFGFQIDLLRDLFQNRPQLHFASKQVKPQKRQRDGEAETREV